MQLSDFIDKSIIVSVTALGGVKEVTLRGVEAGGIWIESQEATNQLLTHFKTATSPNIFVFFVPYQKIEMITVPIPKVGLNEKAFDV